MTGWSRSELERALGSARPPSLNGADLRGTDLTGLELRGLDLAYANLEGANLSGADLTGAVLFSTNARAASLRGADLRGANLTAADLTRADLTGARLDDADVSGTDLTGAWADEVDTLRRRGAIVHPADQPDTLVDPRARSGPVSIQVGDVLRVVVEEPGAAGYRWAPVEPGVEFLDARESATAADSVGSRAGGRDHRTFRFRARQPGTGTLVLRLGRSWETGPSLDEVRVDVVVRARGSGTDAADDPDLA